jgi:hypothetical protein
MAREALRGRRSLGGTNDLECQQYLRFSGHQLRPVLGLINAIDLASPNASSILAADRATPRLVARALARMRIDRHRQRFGDARESASRFSRSNVA